MLNSLFQGAVQEWITVPQWGHILIILWGILAIIGSIMFGIILDRHLRDIKDSKEY